MILGIETVTRVGSLAVVDSGDVVAQATIDTSLNHASGLISVLDNLLASNNIDISEINTIAVDVGPGSFTGIRVGIASAKGLAQSGGRRLAGMCSLEVLCCQLLKEGMWKEEMEYLIPFIDAKRGGVYTGWYQVDEKSRIQIVKEPHLTTIKELLDEIPVDSYIFGPDMEMIREGEKSLFPSAGTLAWLAGEKINEGKIEKNVEPMYIYDVEYKRT